MTISAITTRIGPNQRIAVRNLVGNRRILSLVDQSILSVANMCTSIIIARTCAKQQFGLYASGLSLILFMTAVQSAVISLPYTISSPHLKGESGRVFKGSTFLQEAVLVFAGMLVFLVLGLEHLGKSDPLQPIFLMLAGCSGLICFRDFARRICYADLDVKSALALDGITATVQLIGIALLATLGALSAVRALSIVALATGVASVLWLRSGWRGMHFRWAQLLADFRRNWALGRWMLSCSILWSICIDQYPWILTTLRGSSNAAIWASCFGVMSFLKPCVTALNNDAAPRVASDYAMGGVPALRGSVYRCARTAGLVTLPLVLGLILWGGSLVRLLYGARYGGTSVLVSLLSLGFWFYAIGLAFPYGILALQRPRLDFAINVICFVVFIGVGLWLVRTYGVFGAVCSFLMVQAVAVVARVIGFQSVLRKVASESAQ